MNNTFNLRFFEVRIRYMLLNSESGYPLIIDQPITISYDHVVQNANKLKSFSDELSATILKSILEKVGDNNGKTGTVGFK